MALSSLCLRKGRLLQHLELFFTEEKVDPSLRTLANFNIIQLQTVTSVGPSLESKPDHQVVRKVNYIFFNMERGQENRALTRP